MIMGNSLQKLWNEARRRNATPGAEPTKCLFPASVKSGLRKGKGGRGIRVTACAGPKAEAAAFGGTGRRARAARAAAGERRRKNSPGLAEGFAEGKGAARGRKQRKCREREAIAEGYVSFCMAADFSHASFVGGAFLEEADDLPGEQHREQRPAHAFQRDVAQGEQENEHVAHKIGPLDVPAREVRSRHGEGVVAAGGAACTHADAYAYAYEGRPCEGGHARMRGQRRPERREELAHGIGQREAAASHGGIEDEVAPQYAPAYEVAQGVHHEAGPRGRYAEPVLEQERRAQDAAFRHAGEGVDIAKAEGEYGRTEQIQQALAQREAEGQGRDAGRRAGHPGRMRQRRAAVKRASSSHLLAPSRACWYF